MPSMTDAMDFNNLIDEIATNVAPKGDAVPAKALVTPAPEAEEAEPDAEELAPEEEVVEEEASEEEEAEPVVLPEGMVAVPTIADKLVTEFVLRDNTGEEVETPALVIEYKANGKIRKDRIDQVVKLAQFGVYNQEREQTLQAQQQEAEDAVQDALSQLDMREQQIRNLLEDEEAYLRIREQYMAENEPEKRARRAESEVQEMRNQRNSERQAQQAERFYSQSVVPALQDIASRFPEVDVEEVSSHLGAALVPIMKNGVVPPAMYPQVEQYIATSLMEWAEAKHNARVSRFSGQQARAKQEVEAAKIATAKAKRSAATAARPAVRSAASSSAKKQALSDNATLEDAENAALDAILSSLK